MWQDSGRYEWPLTGPYPLSTASAPLVQVVPVQTPDQVVTIAAPTDIWHTVDGTAARQTPDVEEWSDLIEPWVKATNAKAARIRPINYAIAALQVLKENAAELSVLLDDPALVLRTLDALEDMDIALGQTWNDITRNRGRFAGTDGGTL